MKNMWISENRVVAENICSGGAEPMGAYRCTGEILAERKQMQRFHKVNTRSKQPTHKNRYITNKLYLPERLSLVTCGLEHRTSDRVVQGWNSDGGTSLRNFGNSVYPALPVSFGGDTNSRRSLLSGVYARESKRSHTGGKCVLHHSY